jgi:hypothetical protein
MPFVLPRRTGLALGLFCVTFPAIAQTPEASLVSILCSCGLIPASAALLVGFAVWWFNQLSIRRSARQDHVRMLLDIDRQLIEKPELWLVYDDFPVPSGEKKDKCAWDPARRKAFVYFHLNTFEAFFDFHRSLAPIWEVDKEYEKSWKHYIKDFFKRSPEARELWGESRTQDQFSKGFVDFIREARESQSLRDSV